MTTNTTISIHVFNDKTRVNCCGLSTTTNELPIVNVDATNLCNLQFYKMKLITHLFLRVSVTPTNAILSRLNAHVPVKAIKLTMISARTHCILILTQH